MPARTQAAARRSMLGVGRGLKRACSMLALAGGEEGLGAVGRGGRGAAIGRAGRTNASAHQSETGDSLHRQHQPATALLRAIHAMHSPTPGTLRGQEAQHGPCRLGVLAPRRHCVQTANASSPARASVQPLTTPGRDDGGAQAAVMHHPLAAAAVGPANGASAPCPAAPWAVPRRNIWRRAHLASPHHHTDLPAPRRQAPPACPGT